MSPENLTGRAFYKKIINGIADGSDSPDKDSDAFRYHVQHTFGSLVGHIRNSRSWGEIPDEDDISLLRELLNLVPNVLEYYPEDRRDDMMDFLKSEGLK